MHCKLCNTEIHSGAIKCELCKAIVSPEICNLKGDELENDYIDIDSAEMNGNIVKLENLDEFFKSSPEIEENNSVLFQAIKEEPEFQIDPDLDVNIAKSPDENKKHPHHLKCSKCNKYFKRKYVLENHFKTAHVLSNSEANHSETKVICSSKKSNRARSYIETFSDINEDQKPSNKISKCDFCNEFFTNIQELESHKIKCATKEKFFCDVCNIYVSSQGALVRHKQSKQHNLNQNKPLTPDEFKYQCDYCCERFPLQIHLTNHKKYHDKEPNPENKKTKIEKLDGRVRYICRQCGKSSPHKSAHFEHLRVHTKKKIAKCELCGSEFTSRSSLARHMELHLDSPKYECEICGMNYRHRRNLRKHLFRHTGERPFKCEYCDKTFAYRHIFNDHVRLLHTGETPYECEVCQTSFKTSYLMNIHRREVHNIDTNTKRRVHILEIEPNCK